MDRIGASCRISVDIVEFERAGFVQQFFLVVLDEREVLLQRQKLVLEERGAFFVPAPLSSRRRDLVCSFERGPRLASQPHRDRVVMGSIGLRNERGEPLPSSQEAVIETGGMAAT